VARSFVSPQKGRISGILAKRKNYSNDSFVHRKLCLIAKFFGFRTVCHVVQQIEWPYEIVANVREAF
jgi:hypothetical protein